MNWGLEQRDIDSICNTFAQYNAIDKVFLFGSRAKGNFQTGSDIDLAIKGENFNPEQINTISFILNEELPIPFFIDLLYLDNLKNPDLIDHINRVGKVFYTKTD